MTPYYQDSAVQIFLGDCRDVLKTLPDASVNCCVTSPPYWGLRDYGVDSQLGLERTPDEYVAAMVAVFREVRRVLREDGTLWLNLGDSYCSQGGLHDDRQDNQPNVGAARVWRNGVGRADGVVDERGQRNRNGNTVDGLKPKDLVGIPWRVAFALQADGWYLRQDIIWHKPNPMPESVTDRCTKAHEYVFLLSKSARYYYDAGAIKEDAVGWNGSRFEDGKNAMVHPNVGKKRKPAGWDTSQGSHGSFHRDGRAKEVEYTEGVCEKRNKRSVWTVPTQPYSGAHFATFPPALITPCILAGCPQGGTVLDPFGGSGTTAEVAEVNGRRAILIELNPEYVKLQRTRTAQRGLFATPPAKE